MSTIQRACIISMLVVALCGIGVITRKLDNNQELIRDIIKNQFTTYNELYTMRSNMMMRNRLDGYKWIVKSTNDTWNVIDVDIRMKGGVE